MDDAQAIARMKRGDIGGLAAIVERYQVKAVRTAYLIMQDRAAAEDVVQNCFLNAYRAIGGFDASRPFEAWFLRSVVNASVQAAKKTAQNVSLEGNDAFEVLLKDDAASPEAAMEWMEQRKAVQAALAALSPEQRAAVVLRYYLDLSEAEAAQKLEVAPGTIRWRLHEARKRLAVILRSNPAIQEG